MTVRTHMYLMYMPNRHQTKAVRTCIEFLSRVRRAAIQLVLKRGKSVISVSLDVPI